jgi:hypothetical protein
MQIRQLVRKSRIELLLMLLLVAVLFLTISRADNTIGGNYKNITVHTSVNITNTKPEILSLTVYQETNLSAINITLFGGQTRNVTCNASLRDWNGYNDIVYVNATLFYINNVSNNADDNNTHYTNNNCTNSGNGVNYTVNYMCVFPVYYYANNGTWTCNVTVKDTYNISATRTNTTYIYALYALNVTNGLDFGSAAVETYTNNATANITNFGNSAINVSVEGYGTTRGDGLAMSCGINGNITVANERFSITDVTYNSRTALSSSAQLLQNLTLPKQTIPGTQIVNTTYWQLYIDSTNNPAGNCSGNVIFQAEAP